MTLDSGEFVATPLIAQYTALFPEFNWRVGAHQEVILSPTRRNLIADLEPEKAEFLEKYAQPSVHVWWLTKSPVGAMPLLPEWSSMSSQMRSPHSILLDELSLASFIGELRRDLRQGFERLDVSFRREHQDQAIGLPKVVDTYHAVDHSVQHAYRTYDEINLRAARFEVHHFDERVVPDVVISAACGQQIDVQRFAPTRHSSVDNVSLSQTIIEILDAIGRGEWRGQKATENPIFDGVVNLDTLACIVDQPADQLEHLLDQLTVEGEVVQLQAHDLYASRSWVPAPEFFDIATGDELLAVLHPQSVAVVERNCPQLQDALRFDWSISAIPRPDYGDDLGDALDW